jgi:hypothetical protein
MGRRIKAAALVLPLSLAPFSCSSKSSQSTPPPSPDAGPPRVCKTPSPPAFPWFVDVTNDVGLAPNPKPVLGTVVVSADFDGDGFPDLLTFQGTTDRATTLENRWVLMNRPNGDAHAPQRQFVDTTKDSGLLATRDGTMDRGASNAFLGDLDNDGDVDVVTCPADFTSSSPGAMQDPCAAFLNDGKAHFTIAPKSAVDGRPFAHSGALFDYDRDGNVDWFAGGMAHWPNGPPGTKWNIPPNLFKGAGDGTFTDASGAAGLPTVDGTLPNDTQFRSTFGVTHCDLDDDGDEDVLTASYGREENWVFRNDNGKFTEVGRELGLAHDDREDYSDDQSYRCYCASGPTPPCPGTIPAPTVRCYAFGGSFFRGWAPGVTDQPYSLGGNNFGVVCGDMDNDGDMDVLYATIVHSDVGSSSDPTEIAYNPGGGQKFVRPGNATTGMERKEIHVQWDHGDNMPSFVDVDLDGRKDISLTATVYPTNSHTWLWHQTPDGKFEEISQTAGMQRNAAQGVAWVDIDGDGDLDLVLGDSTGKDGVRVYRNQVAQDQNFVRVRLVGKGAGGSNALGVGARVRVTAGGQTQTMEVQGGQGFVAQQNDFVLTFGLGSTCDIDKIEVRWPDAAGTVATYNNVRANYTIVLHEGDPTVAYK